MAEISRIASGAPWEPIFGYSRAVKAGGWLAVSGTTGFDENGLIVGRNQMYVQARQAIANIAMALERAGMTLAEVVRTRVFVTDMERFGEVARAHLEAFGANPPASTVVEVRRLVNPDMMIEIEADAYREVAVAAAGAPGGIAPGAPAGAGRREAAGEREASRGRQGRGEEGDGEGEREAEGNCEAASRGEESDDEGVAQARSQRALAASSLTGAKLG
jgi:enamine deaminase RidA (YjgF/YER057c/UK114 family)